MILETFFLTGIGAGAAGFCFRSAGWLGPRIGNARRGSPGISVGYADVVGLRGDALSGGPLPGNRESGPTAVQRAGQRLGGAGAVDHGDLVIGERGDAACGAALGGGCARGGPGPEVGQRLNTA